MACNRCETMEATVLHTCPCKLLVCDHCTRQEVLVHTQTPCGHCVGDRLCIEYSGAMTASIPPQITATCICPLSCH